MCVCITNDAGPVYKQVHRHEGWYVHSWMNGEVKINAEQASVTFGKYELVIVTSFCS